MCLRRSGTHPVCGRTTTLGAGLVTSLWPFPDLSYNYSIPSFCPVSRLVGVWSFCSRPRSVDKRSYPRYYLNDTCGVPVLRTPPTDSTVFSGVVCLSFHGSGTGSYIALELFVVQNCPHRDFQMSPRRDRSLTTNNSRITYGPVLDPRNVHITVSHDFNSDWCDWVSIFIRESDYFITGLLCRT